MTAYSAIANSEIAVGAPLTNSLMTKVRDNPLAIQENDASAPIVAFATASTSAGSITSQGALATLNSVAAAQIDADAVGQSEIAANAVGQSEIKTTYQEVSAIIPSLGSNETYFTFSGGVYAIGHHLRASTSGGTRTQGLDRSNATISTSNLARWRVWGTENSGVAFTSYARLYYINSSPPYDLGFGNVPLFIFLIIDNKSGEVEAVSVSTEAPWHYNGKTNITPSRYDESGNAFVIHRQGNEMIEVPLTQDIKNADMVDIPHPFHNQTGKTVAIINPQNSICEDLLTLHVAGESVCELFHNGGIIVGNTHMVRGFDPSVKCFDISYK